MSNNVYVVVKNVNHEQSLYDEGAVTVFANLDEAKAFCDRNLPNGAVWFEQWQRPWSSQIDAWYCFNGDGKRLRYRVFLREIGTESEAHE